MQGKYHFGLGVAVGVSMGVLTANNQPMPAICTSIACMIGSILPDIDTKTSKAAQISKTTSFVLRIFFGHRGVMHTPFILFVLNLPLVLLVYKFGLPWQTILGFNVGFLLHLLQDSFTKRGIRWGYPFTARYFSIFPMKSGKHDFTEIVISTLIYVVVIGIVLLITFKIQGITDYRLYLNTPKLSDFVSF